MSSPNKIKQDQQSLEKIAKQLKLQLIKSEKKFDDLCQQFNNKKIDWPFHGTKKEYLKLEKLLNRYKK